MKSVAQIKKDSADLIWSPRSIKVSYSVHVHFSGLNKRKETSVDNMREIEKALFTFPEEHKQWNTFSLTDGNYYFMFNWVKFVNYYLYLVGVLKNISLQSGQMSLYCEARDNRQFGQMLHRTSYFW